MKTKLIELEEKFRLLYKYGFITKNQKENIKWKSQTSEQITGRFITEQPNLAVT